MKNKVTDEELSFSAGSKMLLFWWGKWMELAKRDQAAASGLI